MKYGIDWSKVDEANEPRLAALKPKVTAVTEQGSNAVVETTTTRKPRTKRAPKPAEEA